MTNIQYHESAEIKFLFSVNCSTSLDKIQDDRSYETI